MLTTCVEQSGDEQSAVENPVLPAILIPAPSPTPSRKSSLKVRRGSSKKKKIATKIHEGEKSEILNNGKSLHQTKQNGDDIISPTDNRKSFIALTTDKDNLLQKTNCIKNDLPTNKSPRMHVRRSSSIKSDCHQMMQPHVQQQYLSNKYINSNQYHNLGRKNSINVAQLQHPHYFHQQYHQRRMSSIEHTFEKQSNININNFENFMQQNIKVDLQKSASSINQASPTPEQMTESIRCDNGSKIIQIIKRITKIQHFTEERE